MPAQDLSNLNGVTFTESEVGGLKNPVYTNAGGASSGDAVFQSSTNNTYSFTGTHTYDVTVLNTSTYTPASDNGTSTTAPIFGEIKVIEHINLRTETYYFNVQGFAANGILLGAAGSTPGSGGGRSLSAEQYRSDRQRQHDLRHRSDLLAQLSPDLRPDQ